MDIDLASGGHLTHGSPVNFTGKTYKFVHYGLSPKTGQLDYMEILKMADKVNPKLILCGYTAYSREVDFKKFREIAGKGKTIAMAVISHITVLIFGDAHRTPLPFFMSIL